MGRFPLTRNRWVQRASMFVFRLSQNGIPNGGLCNREYLNRLLSLPNRPVPFHERLSVPRRFF